MDSTLVSTSPAKPSLVQQLDEENARATRLDAMIAALELLDLQKLGLNEDSVHLFRQIVAQLSYQEFVYLPTKRGSASVTVLGRHNLKMRLQK